MFAPPPPQPILCEIFHSNSLFGLQKSYYSTPKTRNILKPADVTVPLYGNSADVTAPPPMVIPLKSLSHYGNPTDFTAPPLWQSR